MAKKGVKSSVSEKKVAKKPATKTAIKKTTAPKVQTQAKDESLQKMLIENFVSFQTVMADLTSKLNSLSTQLSDLLNLFEKSAKTFMEKDIKIGGTDKVVAEKLDKLLEQNKVLAQGISLLHEVNSPEENEEPEEEPRYEPEPEMPPEPRRPMPRNVPRPQSNMQRQPQPSPAQQQPGPKPLQQDFKEQGGNTNYQKSISSQY